MNSKSLEEKSRRGLSKSCHDAANQRPESGSRDHSQPIRGWASAIAISLFSMSLYVNTLNHQFVYDDRYLTRRIIHQNIVMMCQSGGGCVSVYSNRKPIFFLRHPILKILWDICPPKKRNEEKDQTWFNFW